MYCFRIEIVPFVMEDPVDLVHRQVDPEVNFLKTLLPTILSV